MPAAVADAGPPPPARTKIVAFEVDLPYSCALTDSQKVACWDGDADPVWIEELPPIDRLHVGFRFACARAAADHRLWCWGMDGAGQLGRRKIAKGSSKPVVVNGNDGKPLSVDDFLLGNSHVCVLTGDAGVVTCWGNSIDGESGVMAGHDAAGNWVPVLTPRIVFRNAKRLYGGAETSCAVNVKDELWCWGDQDAGYSSHGATAVPKRFPIPGHVKTMSFASGHSCILQEDGAVLCRGWNPGGELGSAGRPQAPMDGKGARDSDFQPAFTKIPELAGAYTDVAASRHETCAVDQQRRLQCVGTLDVMGRQHPGNPALPDAVAVASTMGRRCVIDTNGAVWCIGYRTQYGGKIVDMVPVEVRLP